jgi:SOS response regulatory protein OraA/RecX
MAIVAFCRDEHPKLLDDARYASAFVRGRNDYAYRHDRIAEANLRRLFIATTKPYNGLGNVIIGEEHRTLS